MVFYKLEKEKEPGNFLMNPLDDSLRAFEVNVNLIFDTIIQSISSRFSTHGQLCENLSCLDPNNFEIDVLLPTTVLSNMYDEISHFIPDITYDALRKEFINF
jgi:hypothetical protein